MSLLQRFDYAKNRYAVLDWFATTIGAGFGAFVSGGSDLYGFVACTLFYSWVAWGILQACRESRSY